MVDCATRWRGPGRTHAAGDRLCAVDDVFRPLGLILRSGAMSRVQREDAPGNAADDGGLDVVVVGAGFSGLYMLHRLRDKGLTVTVLEAAPEVGGTWYWNAYPGRAATSRAWTTPTRFPQNSTKSGSGRRSTPASRKSSATSSTWRRDSICARHPLQHSGHGRGVRRRGLRWQITTEGGERFVAQFRIFATGGLSAPLGPPFEGVDRFAGEWYTTGQWPHEPVDFRGKRVAIVGTGSSTGCRPLRRSPNRPST